MDEAFERGRVLLAELEPMGGQVAELAKRLAADEGSPDNEQDPWAWLSCVLGLVSASEGNYGVGAVVVRGSELVSDGRNRLLRPRLNTSAHAEAQALDAFEAQFGTLAAGHGTVLYTSLECCPMCTVRLLNSGIRTVRYLAPDQDGGMVTRMDGLPPYWQRLAAGREPRQVFEPADCSPGLAQLAADVFAATETRLNDEVVRS
ncbi:nucleoside deaminase [Saccharopolyspora pogona]|uniref:nucleoside deaminase n=1 Tax=Saccharopolyspora pogona TaxID=333966 RepID=UPI001682A22C|nr:nucleoside deaminase [Saccharopolyspora pogona]